MKTVKKIWGKELWIVNNELYCYKKLHLLKGYQCSLHCHKIKDETFIIEEGKVELYYGDKILTLTHGDKVRIKPNVYHKFVGKEHSLIIEISTTHMDEDSYRKTESGKVDV